MKILAIEDNPRLSEGIKRQLRKKYIVDIAGSGEEGLQQIADSNYDIVLLDLGLPDMPGLEVCKHIRQLSSEVPILVVTGIDSTASRVELLNNGADDYISKPFDPSELLARIESLLRRRSRGNVRQYIKVGDLLIDILARKVSRSGISIVLRRKEFDILEYLARNQGRVLSRQMIINHAWPSSGASWVGSVDVHIKQLRDKVDRPFNGNLIKTSYGVGYLIDKSSTVKISKQ